MLRFYKQTTSSEDLKELEHKAVAEGTHAVVFTKKGNIYIWDNEQKKPVQIEPGQAKEILNVSDGDFVKIINSQGKYVIPETLEIVEEFEVEKVQELETENTEEPTEKTVLCESSCKECFQELIEVGKETNKKLDRIIELRELEVLE